MVKDHLKAALPDAVCVPPAVPCAVLASVGCVPELSCSLLHLSQRLVH